MGDDVKILAVSAASAAVAVVAGLVLARSIVRSVERVRDASARVARRRPHRARAGVGARRGRRSRGVVQRDGGEPRAALRRTSRARRLGEPRPAHAAREHAGDARGARGRARRARRDASRPAASRLRILSTLVDDLFELARIDAGALTLELRDACSSRVVESCLRGVEADARRRGVGLDVERPRRTLERACAPEKVERVLFNLLTNALRHTPSDGSVAVRVEQLDRRGSGERRGHRRGSRRRGAAADVRSLLACATPRARHAARGSGSRSPAGSSRRTAAGSGPRTGRKAGHASRSRCPARVRPSSGGSVVRAGRVAAPGASLRPSDAPVAAGAPGRAPCAASPAGSGGNRWPRTDVAAGARTTIVAGRAHC